VNSWNGTSPRPDDWVGSPHRADGVITGVNARGEFRVKLVNGRLVHARPDSIGARISDELHRWLVRLLPGDKVEVDLENPQGSRGVILDRRLPDGRSLLTALRQTPPVPPGFET